MGPFSRGRGGPFLIWVLFILACTVSTGQSSIRSFIFCHSKLVWSIYSRLANFHWRCSHFCFRFSVEVITSISTVIFSFQFCSVFRLDFITCRFFRLPNFYCAGVVNCKIVNCRSSHQISIGHKWNWWERSIDFWMILILSVNELIFADESFVCFTVVFVMCISFCRDRQSQWHSAEHSAQWVDAELQSRNHTGTGNGNHSRSQLLFTLCKHNSLTLQLSSVSSADRENHVLCRNPKIHCGNRWRCQFRNCPIPSASLPFCLCKSMHLFFSASLFCSFQLSLPHMQSLTMCSDRNENSAREKGRREKKRGREEFRPTPYHKSIGGIHACTPVYTSLAPRLLFIIRNVIFDINQGRKRNDTYKMVTMLGLWGGGAGLIGRLTAWKWID